MKKVIILTLLSALFIAGIAYALPGRGDRGHKLGQKSNGLMMILKMKDKLELNDKQTEQLENMAVDFRIQQIDLRAEIQKEKVLMRYLMRNDDAAEKEVFDKIDKIAGLKADSKKLRFSQRKAVQNILTDEQSEKLQELRKKHRFMGKSDGDCEHPPEFGPQGRNFKGNPHRL